MKICFLARPSYDVYSVNIIKNLQEKHDASIEACFVTSDKSESEYILKNVENAQIFETSSYLKRDWDKFTLEKLIEYEKKYDCAPIWKYIYTDRFLINRDYDYVVHITSGLFAFFEEIFSKGDVDFYYSETIATLQCYIAYLVGKKYNVKYICQFCARGGLDSKYHYFIMDPFQHNIDMDWDYGKKEYSNEEKEVAELFLTEFENEGITPAYMNYVNKKPRFSWKFFIYPILRCIKFFDYRLNNPYSYMYYQSYKNCTNPIKYYFNYNKSKKLYNDVDYSKKYVYFPLHYQPEASTLVCAEKYEKQMFFIDSWAKSLPADTVLYVKEHYALLGNRNIQFYRELKKYPNVVLIDPFVSSRELILHSVAVTTLTGTAGLEAVFLRKPVFLGGNIDFEKAPGVIKIDDIFDNYLSNLNIWVQPSREEVIQYLCACIKSYEKGNVLAQNHAELIPDNIDSICEALYKKLLEIREDKHIEY